MEQIDLFNNLSSIMIFFSFAIVFLGGVLQGRRKGLTLSNALGMGFRSVQKMMSAQAKTDTQERAALKAAAVGPTPGDGASIGMEEFRIFSRELIAEFAKQTAEMSAERAVDIARLRAGQRRQKVDIAQLRTDLTSSQQQVATLTLDVDTQKTRGDRLETELDKTKRERDDLDKRLDAMQAAHKRERAADRAEHERRIRELMTQIDGKEARIIELERQLEDLRKIKTGSLTPVAEQEEGETP